VPLITDFYHRVHAMKDFSLGFVVISRWLEHTNYLFGKERLQDLHNIGMCKDEFKPIPENSVSIVNWKNQSIWCQH
jgi:hypothetical protein